MSAELEQARGIYQLMVLTAWADGRIDAAELLVEGAIVSSLPSLRELPDKTRLAAEAKALLDEVGLGRALAQTAAALSDQRHREQAFSACARMLEADGTIALQEFAALTALRKLFALDDAVTARLLRES